MSEEKSKKTKKYYDYISVGNRTKQVAYFVKQHDKNRMFVELLKTLNSKQILVIVKSKSSADKLMQYLKENKTESLAIHGNHRDSQIESAQSAFNSKEITILITTNRILDILTLSDVEVLVNYDLPLEAPDYFKGLRFVDEVGESISLVDSDDEKILSTIELMMKCEMAEVEVKNFEHTKSSLITPQNKTKKPRHKKVQQRAKRKAEIKSKWIPSE